MIIIIIFIFIFIFIFIHIYIYIYLDIILNVQIKHDGHEELVNNQFYCFLYIFFSS